jgi:ABC-type multidrug transport system fused ATPase/permease subunit
MEEPVMETETPQAKPILQVAWTRFSELDVNSLARSKSHRLKRIWIAVLGVLATLFAILSQMFPPENEPALLGWTFRVLLILTPLIGSAIAAFTKAFYSSGDWLMLRAAAEEIQKEIYFFRTILQKERGRRQYLETRLVEIQRQLYQSLNGELVIKPYKGPIPSNYYPSDPNSDPGFEDVDGDQYFKYRVENQLKWHRKEIQEYQTERTRLMILILAAGVIGAFLAALGGGFTIWVALTASLTAAFLGWQELRNIDQVVRNYSKVVLELSIVSDHWQNLDPVERANEKIYEGEFHRMVKGAEEVLWAQNMEYIKSQQEALKEADLDKEASLLNRVIRESSESAKRTRQAIEVNIVDFTSDTLKKTEESIDETVEAVLGTLAEEASSELVQQELEAMKQAVVEMAADVKERISSFTASLADLAREFAGVEIGRSTSKEEINAILSRYPKSGDIKG